MKVLLVTPPMSNLNTPYPATAYLTGFLRDRRINAHQEDWSLELALRLFSRVGLARLRQRAVHSVRRRHSEILRHFLQEFERYVEAVEPVVAFLQGRAPGVASRLVEPSYLPGARWVRGYFDEWDARDSRTARHDAAYIATLFLRDLSDVVWTVDSGFLLSSYAQDVAQAPEFDEVLRFLDENEDGLLSCMIEEITEEGLERHRPDLLCLTAPFAGNVAGALRIAQSVRRIAPETTIAMGGGFPNCVLREITDPRFFELVDFLTLDDGERPLECLIEHLSGEREADGLLRTFTSREGAVVFHSSPSEVDIPFVEAATPTYSGLPLDRYIEVRHEPTRTSDMWGRRWNKLTLAHGCYWKKCTFCDTTLDYIGRYQPQAVDRLVDQIETLLEETGHDGFHWVDEAAPPNLLRALSERLLERGVSIRWWGNIRFEKSFTPELARLMARAGCLMVTGGLEVASDRLLARMKKGVTVEQVARVSRAFSREGILVHAYLIYGFPSETLQESVDAMERVRQLFAAGCLHSAHWHRFLATEYSPIGLDPAAFGIRLKRHEVSAPNRVFGRFKIPYEDPSGVDHDSLEEGLWKSLRSYERGKGLDRPVHEWFESDVPETTVEADAIARTLGEEPTPRSATA